MSILVCAATSLEINPSIAAIGASGGEDTDLLITGVGLMATTYALSKAIWCKRPQLVIQAGVGGSIDPKLLPGQVVGIRKEYIGDLGVREEERFKSIFDLGLLGHNSLPWKDGFLINEHQQLLDTGLPLVTGVSVNEISTSSERIDHYRNSGAAIESMEGAALHYICLMEEIPFIQLRSVSNFAGERDKSKWVMKEAVDKLNTALQKLIKQYKSI